LANLHIIRGLRLDPWPDTGRHPNTCGNADTLGRTDARGYTDAGRYAGAEPHCPGFLRLRERQ
jgi:hypothetical protein